MPQKLIIVVLAFVTLAAFAAFDSSPAEAAEIYMGCFIDTPAFDTYRADNCFQLGSSPSTASFKVFNTTTGQTISWSVSGCSGLWCNVPISPGQSITVSATVYDGSTVVATPSATATYIFEPGF